MTSTLSVYRVPGHGFLVAGTLRLSRTPVRIELRTADALSANLLASGAHSFDGVRDAGGRPRLVVHLAAWAGPESFAAGAREVSLTITTDNGRSVTRRVRVLGASGASIATAHHLLTRFDGNEAFFAEALEDWVAPALSAQWEHRGSGSQRGVTRDFGPPCGAPRASIVIPVYGRADLLRAQLALFCADPGLADAELVFAIDDPPLLETALVLVRAHAALGDVPVRVVHSGRNLGFAGAVSLGVQAARAPVVVVMNSDVFPLAPGWLAPLVKTWAGLPRPAILGARLLYEDGSLQHDGMGFLRHAEWDGAWINDHPGKGLAPVARTRVAEVPAVTGALMVLDTAFYRQLGGFDRSFIVGDYEDSDFCLRARAVGARVYCTPEPAFYHLERQVQDLGGGGTWRERLSRYNCWLQNRRWGEQLSTEAQGNPTLWWRHEKGSGPFSGGKGS